MHFRAIIKIAEQPKSSRFRPMLLKKFFDSRGKSITIMRTAFIQARITLIQFGMQSCKYILYYPARSHL